MIPLPAPNRAIGAERQQGRLSARIGWAKCCSPPNNLSSKFTTRPRGIVLAVTGGGSRAIADLLAVPGGSRTLLEAVVPYSASALAAWLGSRPDEFCSAATARAMAMVAFQRGRLL